MKPPRAAIAVALLAAFLASSLSAQSEWREIAPGVAYRAFEPAATVEYHVTRIDVTGKSHALVTSRRSDRGLTVSEYAGKVDAIVAVNGDYFDEQLQPTGRTLDACGAWPVANVQRRETLVAFGEAEAALIEPQQVESGGLPAWATYGISGWPVLVRDCRALSGTEVLGSDSFARAPHARTAVGLSSDQRTLFLVVAEVSKDGRHRGVTLPDLAAFMREELGACSAVNLDGGGSSAMVLGEKRVNDLLRDEERRVANHIAVVRRDAVPPCEDGDAKTIARGAADLWSDVEEILGGGRAGKNRWTYLSARLEVTMQKLRTGVNATGSIIAPVGVAEAVDSTLRNSGFTTRPKSIGGGDIRIAFRGSGSATDLAHAIRRAAGAKRIEN